MRTEPIIIDETGVEIHPSGGEIWMTRNEIARTFGVFVSTVGANVRSILKNKVLRDNEVIRETHLTNGSVITRYNLEMVAALAFRFDSWQAGRFRRWLIREAVSPTVLWKIPRTDAQVN